IDHPEAMEKFRAYESRLKDINPQVYFISSMTGEGVLKLLRGIKELLDGVKGKLVSSS
ncbi:uncharacterized protein METZ01_LOCUS464498, partial [marine metagenome]